MAIRAPDGANKEIERRSIKFKNNFTSVLPVARELIALRISSPVRSAKPMMNSD